MINGKIEQKESVSRNNVLEVGIFNANVVTVNPSKKEFSDMLGIPEDHEKPEFSYTKQNDNGKNTVTINIWTKDTESGKLRSTRFYLTEDNYESKNTPGNFQWINSVGQCSWAKNEEGLQSWFVENKSVRKSYQGEEELHEFMRNWLSELLKDPTAEILLDTKKLFTGDVSEIKEAITRFPQETLCQMATIRDVSTPEGIKQYQGVYNKKALPGYFYQHIKRDGFVKGSIWDKFVKKVQDPQYPLKDKYSIKTVHAFTPEIDGNDSPIIQGKQDIPQGY